MAEAAPKCEANRSCVFPPALDGLCRYHLQDLEFPFSLQDVSNIYQVYSWGIMKEFARDRDGAVRGLFGFSIAGKGGAPLWQTKIRVGKWRRKIDFCLSVSRGVKRRQREREAYPFQLRTEEEHKEWIANKLVLKEEYAKWRAKRIQEIAAKREEIHRTSKWGANVDACANLLMNQSVRFASAGCPKRYSQNLRAILSGAKPTRLTKFSVRPQVDGSILVTKVGNWDYSAAIGNNEGFSGAGCNK